MMLLFIPLIPILVGVVLLIGAGATGLAARRAGRGGGSGEGSSPSDAVPGRGATDLWKAIAGPLAVAGTVAAAALSVVVFFKVRGGGAAPELNWLWFHVGRLEVPFGLHADGLSALMLVVVAGVSVLVHLYSNGYMAGDRDRAVYFAELSLFSGAMLLLVLASNLFVLYLAWELVGATSYLLIGYYFERPAAAAAGKKAFLVTRIGDLGLLIAIFALVTMTGSLRFDTVFAQVAAGVLTAGWAVAVPLLLFAGAAGKSAQFPLHVWLPDAMEGPTPVSALIHAATMVAAGVYLVARMFPLIGRSATALDVICWIGAFTALMAATIAVTQVDIKKVLAYSTISQLGFMMAALGAFAPGAGIFHLFTHAWFKALLFLGAGSVIHATGRQTVGELGRLARRMPVTATTFVIGALALAGIPPLAGFWSKDEILASVAARHPWQFAMLLVATFLTAFYVFRLVFLVFWGPAAEGRDAAWEGGPVAPTPAGAAPGGRTVLQAAVTAGALHAATAATAQEAALEAADREHGHARALHGVDCGGDEEEATTAGRVLEPDACEIDFAAAHAVAEPGDARDVAPDVGGSGAHGHDGPAHESGRLMTVPLMVLAAAALVAGFAGAPFLGSRLQSFIGLHDVAGSAAMAAPLWITVVAVGLALAGIGSAWLGYGRPRDAAATWDVALQRVLRGGYGFVARGYGMDALYARLVVRPYLGLSRFLAGAVDTVVIDGAVNGLARLIPFAGGRWRRLQSGEVRGYLIAMTAGALLVAAVLWRFV
jgi:proton-translocating NADH-quinone oxidoreductase chain L